MWRSTSRTATSDALLPERKARRRMAPVAEIDAATRADDMALREQVSKLPRRQREALILHYYSISSW